MSGYRLTPAARRDLSSIWDFTQKQWDLHQAEIYINEIRTAMEHIAERPDIGREVNEIRDGYRRYSVGSHLIFYIARNDTIDVIRILHHRMDPTRHL